MLKLQDFELKLNKAGEKKVSNGVSIGFGNGKQHNEEVFLGNSCNGWGWYNDGRIYHCNIMFYFKDMKFTEGDIVGFEINKLEKIVYLIKNKIKTEIKSGMNKLPEIIQIAAAKLHKNDELELIYFKDYEQPDFKPTFTNENIEERMNFLCEKEYDLEIEFKNKKMNFWKTLSNNLYEKNDILRKIRNFESNVNEKDLLSIIIGRKIEIPNEHLADYYYFFKTLNIKHCITSIHQKIDKITDFKNAYFLFKNFCLKYENEVIKSWFSMNLTKVKKIQSTTFKTSFALSLFNKMKKMEIENDRIGLKLLTEDIFFGHVWYHIKEYKITELIKDLEHKDFEEDGKEKEKHSFEYYFKNLYDNRATNSNLTLISTDKKEFQVHKEILILRYDFFFRLFRFRGSEVTEYKETGKITLVDLMSSDVVKSLISYAYFGNYEVNNEGLKGLETIIKILIFCDQFNETNLLELTKTKLQNLVKIKLLIKNSKNKKNVSLGDKNKNEILEIISNLSNYLVGNSKILGIIVPFIVELGGEINGFFEDLVVQNLKKKEELEISEGDRKVLEERILELEKMVGEMNDKGVGEGQIREREENDDEEDEEIKKEQPKRKKRKFNKK